MKRAAQVVKLGLIQTSCSADPDANLKKTISLIERAAKDGANIICTQELFRSQYFCQSEDHKNFELAEKIPGPSTDAFCKLAKKHKVVIIASLFEKRAAGVYHNTAAVIDADGSLLGIYRKMHIPDDPLFYEKFYFTPGDLGFKTWQTKLRKNRRADLLGSMVSRSRAADRDARRANSYFIRPPSAGIRARKKNTANASTTRGKPSSAATPSPTAASSPCRTASATKKFPACAATALNSGAKVSSPERPAKFSPKPRRTRKRF